MIENTNTKQFYPGPILNNTLEITDFLFNDPTQIKVKYSKLNTEGILEDIILTYGAQYEVTKVLPSDINATEAALTASTGTVTIKNITVTDGEKLTVYRETPLIQDTKYPRTGAFPAASHEGALDYLTMQNQEQQEQIDRSLKIPNSVETFDAQMPTPLPARALKINADGTGFEMSEYDPDLALVMTEEFKNQSQQAAAEALASQNVATEQATIATQKADIATQQADIATQKANEATEVVNGAILEITTTKNTSVEEIVTTKDMAISNIQSEGTTQVNNIRSTGFYLRDDELYFINSQGQEEQFKRNYQPPLLSTIWSDHIINDIQWLRADTFSWQDGNVYSAVYDKLVEEYATGVDETEGSITFKRCTNGFKIADVTQEQVILDKYNTYAIAWYYILDTENKRFKLPRTKFGFEGLRDSVGDDIAESLPNITGEVQGICWQDSNSASGAFAINTNYGGTGGITASNGNRAFDFNASRSASTYKNGAPVQERATQMYLYFYVGNFTQTAIEQTAGINAEMFNGKADVNLSNVASNIRYVVEVSDKSLLPSWYRVYNDGWCEQGGYREIAQGSNIVQYLKNFVAPSNGSILSSSYFIACSRNAAATTANVINILTRGKKANQVDFYSDGITTIVWKADGYIR